MRHRFGPGYYGASLRYLSRDITKIQCSEESRVSSALYISKFYGKTLEEIMGLVSKDSPKKDLRDAVDAVRKMNAAKLAADMWADQDNSGAAGQIKTLEQLAGSVKVDVSDALSEVIDKTKVTMIGAGLNAAPGQSVTLKIGESDEETGVLPVMYDVVPFSIRLTNGEGNDTALRNGELAVPVKLTLPISKTSISLNSLTIRHTCPDGTVEALSANRGLTITWSRDKAEPNYVTFMVRSPRQPSWRHGPT